MGSYTGIRCKVIIKSEYRNELGILHSELNYEWSESNIDFIREFGNKFNRSVFIPCGALCYMPDEWEYVPVDENGKPDWEKAKATDGFDKKFDYKTGIWTFQCSLKNYNNEIEFF
jgi:hypothetical protein